MSVFGRWGRRAAQSFLRKWIRTTPCAERWESRLGCANFRASWGAEEHRLLARNAALRAKHAGRRAFVIGNGPSLREQDLTALGQDVTLVMSGFWKHPVLRKWQPTYYCIADPFFFDGSAPMRDFFSSLRSHARDTTFIVPLEARRSPELLPADRTHYVAFWDLLSRGDLATLDFTNNIPAVRSVAQLAILVALYAGCNPIYLLGLDHDSLSHRGPDLHFYEGKTVEDHPTAPWNLDEIPYRREMETMLDLWRGYENLRAFAERSGVRILNATRGGFLDVFERVSYESLFEKTESSPRNG